MPGTSSCDNAVHGPVRLEEAPVVSCNVTFATLGQRRGRGFARWMDEFGILDELPLVPNTSAARPAQSGSSAAAGPDRSADLLLATGHGRVTAALARESTWNPD